MCKLVWAKYLPDSTQDDRAACALHYMHLIYLQESVINNIFTLSVCISMHRQDWLNLLYIQEVSENQRCLLGRTEDFVSSPKLKTILNEQNIC